MIRINRDVLSCFIVLFLLYYSSAITLQGNRYNKGKDIKFMANYDYLVVGAGLFGSVFPTLQKII
jgi:hypothetical protein